MKINLSGSLNWTPKYNVGDLVEVLVDENYVIGVIWNHLDYRRYEIELNGEPKEIDSFRVKRKVEEF